MLIQIIVTIGIIVLVLPNIYFSYKKNSLTILGCIFWFLFWIAGLVLIWFPDAIEFIGRLFGVERSIDALIYISIVYLLYVSLTQKIKINDIGKEITILNRRLALKDVEKRK